MCVSGYMEYWNRDGILENIFICEKFLYGVNRKIIWQKREIPQKCIKKNFRVSGEKLGTLR